MVCDRSGFIEDQGFTVEDFYERLRQALERNPWSHEAVFAKIMTAVADFDIFMRMMREAAEALPQKESPSKAEQSLTVDGVEEEKYDQRTFRK